MTNDGQAPGSAPHTAASLYDGRYRLGGVIGEGGMARVYRAFDARLQRPVAIKMLREQFAREPQVVERFRQEGRLVAGLVHPHIICVFDFGEERGTPYLVMELVEGTSLRQLLAHEAPLPVARAIALMRQVCAALDYAHAHGIIHRDIKPENILMTDQGDAKVGDFGIARALASTALTATGTLLGTVAYASPEQVQGKPVTGATDLYSAGIVLYELLTAHTPLGGMDPVAMAMAQVQQPPKPPRSYVPTLPSAVEAVVLQALAKDPAQRYQSGYDLVVALTGANSTRQATVPPARAPVRAGRAPAPPVQGKPPAPPVQGKPSIAPTMVAPVMQAPAARRRRAPSVGLLLVALLAVAVLLGAVAMYSGVFKYRGPTAAAVVPTVPAAAKATVAGSAGGTNTQTSISLVTATGVGPGYAATGVASSFKQSAGDVFAVATVHGKARGAAVIFTWKYPDGSTYVYDNDIVAPYAGTVIAYAQLVPGPTGSYTVTTSIAGQVLASATFSVGS